MISKTPRRLLFLLPFAPRLDATNGGGRVAAQLLTALATRHRIALLYLRGAGEPPIDDLLSQSCDLVVEVSRPWATSLPARWWLRNLHLIAGLPRLRPMWVSDWATEEFAQRAQDLAQSWQPDIVQLEYHVMAQYLPSFEDIAAPRILTEYEPGVSAAPYLKRPLPFIGRFVHQLDQLAWRRFERAALRQVQAVVVFTEPDRKALVPLAQSTPIHQIPFGTIVPDRPLDPRGSGSGSLLFFGNFLHPPNLDAARRLVRDIFPAVRARYPQTELYVVGDQAPAALAGEATSGAFVVGRVVDLQPYLDRAAVFVAPIQRGGGMRVKVLEALAAGKAVVASRLAVEGLDLIDGEQCVLAESDGEFVEQIVALLGDPARRIALARRAYAWARANLGWERPVAAYEALYATLLQGSETICSIRS